MPEAIPSTVKEVASPLASLYVLRKVDSRISEFLAGLNANYAKWRVSRKPNIRVICLIGGIRVKEFPVLRKPYASLWLAMAWILLCRCNFTGADDVS